MSEVDEYSFSFLEKKMNVPTQEKSPSSRKTYPLLKEKETFFIVSHRSFWQINVFLVRKEITFLPEGKKVIHLQKTNVSLQEKETFVLAGK